MLCYAVLLCLVFVRSCLMLILPCLFSSRLVLHCLVSMSCLVTERKKPQQPTWGRSKLLLLWKAGQNCDKNLLVGVGVGVGLGIGWRHRAGCRRSLVEKAGRLEDQINTTKGQKRREKTGRTKYFDVVFTLRAKKRENKGHGAVHSTQGKART